MRWSDLPRNPTPKQLRQFGGAGFGFFLLLLALPAFLRERPVAASVFATVALLLGLVVWLAPRALKWPFLVASFVTFPIGWALSQLILAFLFFGLFTPLAWFFRLRGRDPLQLRRPEAVNSYWVEKKQPEDPVRYLRQY